MNTVESLCAQIKQADSILCVGLDPRVKADSPEEAYEKIIQHNKLIINSTQYQCACYKPNIAFYEQWGGVGWNALQWTLQNIPSHIPIILDAKRGDIGATAEAYAHSAFEHLKVDSITLAPYIGTESIKPFVLDNKLLFILVRTSNPQSELLQRKAIQGTTQTQALYLEVAEQFSTLSNQIGFVVGANCYEELSIIRKSYPDRWILAPGIGAQGGDILNAIESGINDDGLGLLPVVARGIANAKNPELSCREYNKKINSAIHTTLNKRKNIRISISTPNASTNRLSLSILQKNIIKKLFEYECIKIGTFILKSGIESPFYIDLRRVISFPDLFEMITQSYKNIVQVLNFDVIAGIPTAALPFAAALAQKIQFPMIYPRISKKSHGSGNTIEGAYEKGHTALLLDDLITKGSSKKEALKILQKSGIQAHDIVVLICRSYNAVDDMKQLGITLHYSLHIDDIIQYATEIGYINSHNLSRIKDFLLK